MIRTSAILVGLVICIAAICAAASPVSLPSDVRAALGQPSAFHVEAAISAIPKAVQQSFAIAVGEKSFSMAAPGAQWQSTDVVFNPRLPWRRLKTVALSASYCVLFYEHGGRGRSDHVVVFRLEKYDAKLVWSGAPFEKITDVAGLLRAIDNGKIEDSSPR